MTTPRLSKAEKLRVVASLILNAAQTDPGASLNLSSIATEASISRAWIYKNFGSKRTDILKTAIDVLFLTFVQPKRALSVWSVSKTEWSKRFIETLQMTLSQVEIEPHLFKFYLMARLGDDDLAKHIKDLERKFTEEIMRPRVEMQKANDYKRSLEIADALTIVRIGFIHRWLSEPHKSAGHREQIALLGSIIKDQNK